MEGRLKKTIIDFIDDITRVFTEDYTELLGVKLLFTNMGADDIKNHTIKFILPFSENIKNRDVEFFKNNQTIFSGLPDDRVAHYGSKIQEMADKNDENLSVIWDYMDIIVTIGSILKKNL